MNRYQIVISYAPLTLQKQQEISKEHQVELELTSSERNIMKARSEKRSDRGICEESAALILGLCQMICFIVNVSAVVGLWAYITHVRHFSRVDLTTLKYIQPSSSRARVSYSPMFSSDGS